MSISPETIVIVVAAFAGTLALARVLEYHSGAGAAWTRQRPSASLSCALIDHRTQFRQCRNATAERRQLPSGTVATVCSQCGEPLGWE